MDKDPTMTEIPKEEIHFHLDKEITIREGGKEIKCVFKSVEAGWVMGYSPTNHSIVQIFLGSKRDEYSAKYFIQ